MSDAKKVINVVSDNGAVMMSLEGFGRNGDRMSIKGSIMGAWSTDMYVDPQDAVTMFGLLLNRQVIGYVLSLPFLLLKKKWQAKTAES